MRIRGFLLSAFLMAASLGAVSGQDGFTVRIKDIAHVRGVRENQLVGMGIVTGLAGKGDSSESALLRKVLSNLVSSFGLEIPPEMLKSRNSAVVMVTADIPAYIRSGDRITVTVASLNDAKSLEGGVLLQTALEGANGSVYAVAQGKIAVPVNRGTSSTVGTIPGGAIAERDVLSDFAGEGGISVILRNPDFTTAHSIAGAIDASGIGVKATAMDASLVKIDFPEGWEENPVALISAVESLMVVPDGEARVVVNPRAGVVVIGREVRIGTVAVSYRGTKIEVTTRSRSNGSPENFLIENTATVGDLVDVLQETGLRTDTIIEILKAIEQAGALYGRLIVM